MASLQYKAVRSLIKAAGYRDMLDKDDAGFERLLERCQRMQKRNLRIPTMLYADCDVDMLGIGGTPCYVIRPRGSVPQAVVLYLFGGNFLLPPDPGDLTLCGEIAEACGAEVWLPRYPMAPEHRFIESVRSALLVYEEILRTHDAADVRVFGASSGASLALALCMYIRHEGLGTPLPGRLVLQSPVLQVPPTKDQMKEMRILSKRDVMIPPEFFDRVAPVLATDGEAYLLCPVRFDLTGFPPIDVFYGSDEILSAHLKYLKAACAKCSVPLRVHIGEGMMHCWGMFGFVPEAKAVRQEYFEALK